jgi:hypothetical protein
METLAAPALTQDFARHFAAEWIDAWNAHDLERVLSHYDDEFEMSSPLIARLAGEPSGKLGHRGPVAEVFRFAPSGKVVSAAAHYL